jgi:hypothetical protein
MPTPNIHAAIRAGCTTWHIEDCTYPACDCSPVVPDMIKTALRAAIPKEPPTEVIEAMARGGCFWSKSSCGCAAPSNCWNVDDVSRAEQTEAYKAQPIYRELWGEE